MICIFWNVRGLTKFPTRLVLKKLIKNYKPNFCIISESWMYHVNLPYNWFHRLGLELFATNNRKNSPKSLVSLYQPHQP